jgi:minor histocompatibility antigen H13
MVEVATALDVPVKLVFPNLNPIMRTDTHAACTMLGLGDIVIPGVFILFTKVAGEKIAKLDGSRVYFWGNLLAYALSLFACGVVLVVYHAA